MKNIFLKETARNSDDKEAVINMSQLRRLAKLYKMGKKTWKKRVT